PQDRSSGREDLAAMINELEEENQALLAEYDRLRISKSEPRSQEMSPSSSTGEPGRGEDDLLQEARMLREHKGRLEARMRILEDHNKQLETQLKKLRQLLEQQPAPGAGSRTGTLQTRHVTASQLATDGPKANGITGMYASHHQSEASEGPSAQHDPRFDSLRRPSPPPANGEHSNGQRAMADLQDAEQNGANDGELDGRSGGEGRVNVNEILCSAGDLGSAVRTLVTALTDDEGEAPSGHSHKEGGTS
ncbi:unnamed protein product, partial [Cyprideis torosa]